MDDLGYTPFDCDNHYYEAVDAFTRHVDPAMQPRCVQWAEVNGRRYHLVGGKISNAVVNPTWDPIALPGALHNYFRGNPDGTNIADMLREREPLPRYYVDDRDARVDKVHQQGLQSVWLFPTLGVLYEELIKTDLDAVKALFGGFNRWLEEQWGFAYRDTIFAAPYIPLGDVDWACQELERCLDQGARTIVMRPAAVWTAHGSLSPADEHFDPFWARVNEAGICAVIHAGDSGYTTQGYDEDGFASSNRARQRKYKPSIKAFNIERAAYDYLITLSLEKLFERFTNLRIASVENGSQFLGDMFRKLEQATRKNVGWFKEDPCELFRQHVWINPFWEDDVAEVVHYMGADRVIFGSDWPHIEGMPQPLDYLVELKDKGFDEETEKKILLDNVTELNQLQPA